MNHTALLLALLAGRVVAAGDLPFESGEYRGKGHWIDPKAEGDYTVTYTIRDGSNGTKTHVVHRVFLKPDGSALYEEDSTVTFEPSDRNGFRIRITTKDGTRSGLGYCFGNQCHYELDVSADSHLEFSFVTGDRRIDGLASSTNKGKFTSWRETLDRAP